MITERTAVEDNSLAGTPYRARKRLGGGFAAEVYEVVGPQGELCALKVLRKIHGGSQRAAWRLLQESRVLARLDHPNLVPLSDIGLTKDGRPYFVMPRLYGETLRSRMIRTGALSPKEACAVVAGVLDGLEMAHRKGIVHRDIKPSNIFLAGPPNRAAGADPGETRPVLIDFGIAKVLGATVETTPHQIIGTPRYFSPEQILGGRVDARTDIYAMGLVLYEAVAGRGPYEADNTIDLMRNHLATRPPPLDERASIPAELQRVVGRALEKWPVRRWPAAETFAKALRGLFPDEIPSPIYRVRAARRAQ